MKLFLLCSGVAYGVAMAVLLWLGPVWMHDLEDQVVAALLLLLFLTFLLAALAGAFSEDDLGAAPDLAGHVADLGFRLLRCVVRGTRPAGGGVILGMLAALGTMSVLAHFGPLRMSYARARPQRALAADFEKVGKFLDVHKKLHGRPPQDAADLGRAMKAAGVELSYSTLQNGVWTDPWDRPFYYEAKKGPLPGWKLRVYSFGANGRDDDGNPDDLSVRETLRLWKSLDRLLGAGPD